MRKINTYEKSRAAFARAVKVIPSQIVSAENVDEYIDPANTVY